MRDLVIRRADLLPEREMPPVLLELCAHVSGYEITAARWEREDYREHLSVVPFPGEEIHACAREGSPNSRRNRPGCWAAERRRSGGPARPRHGSTE
ncbi:hypothetical protein [Streptomyces carpaticus]|uniref:Uncharacterized protein n=1 Tax=Streptomyces carpaticus TaxID=285558 RepID=A0ABV4ZFY3_9ACTN